MVVSLFPKFIKGFKHGYFIPNLTFMPCLNRSCAPFITLLDIHKDSVGDSPRFWPHTVCCCDTLSLLQHPCQMQQLNLCNFNRFFSLEHLFAFLCFSAAVWMQTHSLFLALLSVHPTTHQKKAPQWVHPEIDTSLWSSCEFMVLENLPVSEIMIYRFRNESSVSSTESNCIGCLVLLH